MKTTLNAKDEMWNYLSDLDTPLESIAGRQFLKFDTIKIHANKIEFIYKNVVSTSMSVHSGSMMLDFSRGDTYTVVLDEAGLFEANLT